MVKGAQRPEKTRLPVVGGDPNVVDLVRQLLAGQPYLLEAVMDGQEALVGQK